jgi:hypothetical protein
MKKETFIRRLAGTVILTGVAAATIWSDWFILITVFAGANLLQSTYTGVCPAETVYDAFTQNNR